MATPDPAEIERIARGLTAAQREALVHPENGGSDFWAADHRTLRSIARKDLLGKRLACGTWSWSPLGIAVRNLLTSKKDATDGK